MADKPDFSGWATKFNRRCADGRTIMHSAFEHQDKTKVPLVWQHRHNEPANVLGHAFLEQRDEGVYAYGFFNETPGGKNAKTFVEHGDVNSLSIWANDLSQQGGHVVHGNIRELSLVLSGANPDALIENVNIAHGDSIETIIEEATIYNGLEQDLVHGDQLQHADTSEGAKVADTNTQDKTVQAIYDDMTDEQQNVVAYLVGVALDNAKNQSSVAHSATATLDENPSLEDVFNTLDDLQKEAVEAIVSEAVEQADIKHTEETESLKHSMEEDLMGRNVFTGNGTAGAAQKPHLSHDQLKTIVDEAQKNGSFKDAFLAHAQEYGVENIDILFPDAKALANSPEVIGRRTEWVADVINGTKHSPFSRIKSTAVDLTADEARAKGYVKGNMKKDEVIKLLKRVTTPTTIYKKQKLDRDDIIDITDLDVVAWLKAEMRLMLDEELARAVLVGDGRESDDEDKIDTDHIRPIAYDNAMYAHPIVIASELTPQATIEAIVRSRSNYKGTGTPTFYTTDGTLVDLLLQVDKMGRRLYETEAVLAAALRVNKIVVVEVLEDTPEIVGIIVNLVDYTLGADQGGNVSMFDDFDIDYNQFKYLIETRVSGALTKPKSALVIKRTIGTSVTPQQPTYNASTHVLTIPAQDGVVYSIDGEDQEPGAQTITETTEVEARPEPGYSFPANTTRDWTYVY